MSTKWESEGEQQVVEKTKKKEKVDRPRMYKVLLHNDDYTSMEFVVEVLMDIFHKSDTEATRIMFRVHTEGLAVAGIYPFSVAETKAAEVTMAAEKAEFPFLVTLEPEDAGSSV